MSYHSELHADLAKAITVGHPFDDEVHVVVEVDCLLSMENNITAFARLADAQKFKHNLEAVNPKHGPTHLRIDTISFKY